MKIKDVVKKTAVLLDREDVAFFIDNGYADQNDSVKRDVAAFVTAVNFVINELATEYIPALKTERVTAVSGKVFFSALRYAVTEINKVEDENGNEVNFKVFPEYLSVEGDTVYVSYVAQPSFSDLDEQVVYEESALPLYVIAYGAAAEICMIQGRFDEAKEWKEKFEKGVSAIVKPASTLSKLKNVVIKGRMFY